MELPITTIVPHWFDERQPNLEVIVDALMSGSDHPGQILVWNNTPRRLNLVGADVIQSPYNVGSVGRLYAALVAKHSWVLFQDNDVCVERNTLRSMFDWKGLGVVGLQGRERIPGIAYRNWNVLDGATLSDPVRIDVSLGRMELVERRFCIRALPLLPFDVIDDDVWFSHACRMNDIPRWCMPYGDRQGFINLDEGGVGMSIGITQEEHYNRRDKLCDQLWRA